MADGGKIVSQQDSHGNVVKVSYNGTMQIDAQYDAQNKPSTLVEGKSGVIYSWKYDTLDRLEKYSGGRATEKYEYNTAGNLSKKTVTVDGENTVYDYDYKTNAAKDLKSVSVGEISVFPQVDCLGRSTGKEIFVASNGANPVASEQITYRKVGDHATNVPSAMRFGEMRNGQYVMLDNLKYAYDSCEIGRAHV